MFSILVMMQRYMRPCSETTFLSIHPSLSNIFKIMCCIHAQDGEIHLRTRNTVPQGSAIATKAFNCVYYGPLQMYENKLVDRMDTLVLDDPVSGELGRDGF